MGVARALADPVRREILTMLGAAPRSAGAIAAAFDVSRPAVQLKVNSEPVAVRLPVMRSWRPVASCGTSNTTQPRRAPPAGTSPSSCGRSIPASAAVHGRFRSSVGSAPDSFGDHDDHAECRWLRRAVPGADIDPSRRQ